VLADADLDSVAQRLFDASFVCAGQVCIAIKRIYAERSIHRELAERLATLATSVKVGHGLDPETEMGPVQNAKQYAQNMEWLKLAHRDGTVIAGGDVIDRPGYFVAPTIVRDVDDSSILLREETFGPIRPVLAFDDIDEAVQRANGTPFGLGASVWSGDAARATEIADRLEAGTTWVNQHFALQVDVPFGGRKQSGIGVEWGNDALVEFTDVHVMNIARTASGRSTL